MARVVVGAIQVRRSIAQSPGYRAYAEKVGDDLIDAAKGVFNSRQVRGNEGRESETSPPKYLESFETQWRGEELWVVNTDPAAAWVEFGAHAGGKTPVLKYRPMGIAMDIVANREGF